MSEPTVGDRVRMIGIMPNDPDQSPWAMKASSIGSAQANTA